MSYNKEAPFCESGRLFNNLFKPYIVFFIVNQVMCGSLIYTLKIKQICFSNHSIAYRQLDPQKVSQVSSRKLETCSSMEIEQEK